MTRTAIATAEPDPADPRDLMAAYVRLGRALSAAPRRLPEVEAATRALHVAKLVQAVDRLMLDWPNAAGLPADVRAALRAWLDTAEETPS
jgi:hypothetical protein